MQAPPPPPPSPTPPYGYVQMPRTNSTAIVSLVAGIGAWVICPVLAAVVAVITGHVALSQLRTSGEQGRGMALAGTILGYTNLGLVGVSIVVILLLTLFGGALTHSTAP